MPSVPHQASHTQTRLARPTWDYRPSVWWLIGGLIVGCIVWAACGVIVWSWRGGMDACGGLFGDTPVGWPEARGAIITAAVIGGVLWATGGVAAGLRPNWEGKIMLAYPVAYVVALIIFCAAIAPAIWGPAGCTPAPSIFGL